MEQTEDIKNFADPMGDEAAEAALTFLRGFAREAGVRKAQMIYMENYIKVVLNRIKLESGLKSDAAQETFARASHDYARVLEAQREAIAAHEELFWKRIAAEATLEAWRTKNANVRGAHRMT